MTDTIPFDIPADAPDALLEGLNEGQRAAVEASGGPVLILAGAGSGKTRAITHKIAWLIEREGFKPWEILAVTFTNKAAEEMKLRTQHLLGEERAKDVNMGTFHSTCLNILRTHGSLLGYPRGTVVYDTVDQTALLSRILKEKKINEKALSPKRIRAYIDQAKNEGYGPSAPELVRVGEFESLASEIYTEYQRRLKEANAMDFGDLLRLVVRLFEEVPAVLSEYRWRWKYVLVDEFQDTNRVQYRFLQQLCEERGNLCVVGDDDQSIYRWRGARVENILDFPKRFENTQVVRLEQNYRSSGNILAAAGAVIAHNKDRHEKELWTERDGGETIVLHVGASEREEATWIAKEVKRLERLYPLGEMAIFYRTSSLSRVLEDSLRKAHIPYQVIGGLKFYERAEIKDLLAYLKLLVNPLDEMSLVRIINSPTRGIGPGTLDKILARGKSDGVSALEAAHRLAEDGTTAIRNRLVPFCAIMDDLRKTADEEDALTTIQRVLERSGYWANLKAQNTIEAQGRMDNLHEFLISVEEFLEDPRTGQTTDLYAFLDQVALASDIDNLEEGRKGITLMTVHAAKGLEFDVVFLAGMEEGILPHFNSSGDERDIEEERRLTYVAMTRARHLLSITRTRMRRRFGGLVENPPSRFLREIPPEILEIQDPLQARLKAARSSGWTGRPGAAFSDDEQIPEPFVEKLGGGQTLDRSDSQVEDYGAPGKGTVVRHKSFGRGVIERIQGQGPEARITVRFDEKGEKTIIARFLVLSP